MVEGAAEAVRLQPTAPRGRIAKKNDMAFTAHCDIHLLKYAHRQLLDLGLPERRVENANVNNIASMTGQVIAKRSSKID